MTSNITRLRFGCLIAALLALGPTAPFAAAQGGAAAGSFAYKNITTDTTTTLKTGPGYLHTVCVKTPAATGTI